MSIPNRIHATLDSAASEAVTDHVDEIHKLLPFLLGLTAEERQSLPKMGDKSRALVARCLEIAKQDDSFLPRNLDVAEFAADHALHTALEPIRVQLTKLLELVEDTQTAAGSEAYLAALEVYHACQRSGRGTGLDTLVDRVSKRFTGRRTAAETAAEPQP